MSFRRTDYTGAPSNAHEFGSDKTNHSGTVNMNKEADVTALVGPVDGKCCYKKRTDGSADKSMVVCNLCNKDVSPQVSPQCKT